MAEAAVKMAAPVADDVPLLYWEIEIGLALTVQMMASKEAWHNGGRKVAGSAITCIAICSKGQSVGASQSHLGGTY